MPNGVGGGDVALGAARRNIFDSHEARKSVTDKNDRAARPSRNGRRPRDAAF